jgi:hypothetical protein
LLLAACCMLLAASWLLVAGHLPRQEHASSQLAGRVLCCSRTFMAEALTGVHDKQDAPAAAATAADAGPRTESLTARGCGRPKERYAFYAKLAYAQNQQQEQAAAAAARCQALAASQLCHGAPWTDHSLPRLRSPCFNPDQRQGQQQQACCKQGYKQGISLQVCCRQGCVACLRLRTSACAHGSFHETALPPFLHLPPQLCHSSGALANIEKGCALLGFSPVELHMKKYRCKPAMMSLRSLLLAALRRTGPGLHCFTGPALTNVRNFCTAAATDKNRTALLYCVNQVR